MKVYIVILDWNVGTNFPGNDAAIVDVFSTEDAATKFKNKQKFAEQHYVEEWDVNEHDGI